MPCGKSYIFFIFSQVNQNQNSRAYSLTNESLVPLWICYNLNIFISIDSSLHWFFLKGPELIFIFFLNFILLL